MNEQHEKDFQDYVVAIRKRKTAIFAVFSIVFLITIIVALSLPAIYKSGSTILIEQQEIPKELVMSTVTSYAAERIQTIQARVMSRTNLLKIIEKYELYKERRKYQTIEEIIQRIKQDISLKIISADVVDPLTGRPSSATIAFSLSFIGESPAQVQRVANELTTLYLNENLTSRAQKATETSDFFREESVRLSDQIDKLENSIAEFKQKHANALPELQELNVNLMQRKETELTGIDTRIRTLEEKQFYLNGQLMQLDPGDPDIPGSASRLKMLQAEYAVAKSKYSDEHPDIIRLQREIESLQRDTGTADSSSALAQELKLLNSELEQKKQKYTAEHPDIARLKEKIDSLKKELAKSQSKAASDFYVANPDNPLYITIASQLAAVESEIQSIKLQRIGLVKKIQEIEQSLYEAPQVERDYLVLKRDYQNAIQRYQETKAKQMQADVARQLETDNKGERFTLIDPATYPEKPVSPNRPAIIFLGFILAIGSSLGFTLAADAISGTVRGAKSIERLLGSSPLAVIPYEMNVADTLKTKKIKKRVIVLFLGIIILVLLFLHVFVSPLDVLWFRLFRRIEILTA